MNSDWTIAIPPSNFEMGKEDRSCCEDFPDFFKKYAESQRVVCSNGTASSGFIEDRHAEDLDDMALVVDDHFHSG